MLRILQKRTFASFGKAFLLVGMLPADLDLNSFASVCYVLFPL
jgi:hypothetical protein